MPDRQQRIAENLDWVREQISAAAQAAGRAATDVTLVAVTKYVDTETTAALLSAGCRDLGESRPQSLWEKAVAPALDPARWHLVGHLQRNKVRRTLPLTTLIHSADSLRILAAIEQHAAETARTVDVLLEVNTSGDAAKHGFSAEQLPRLLETWVGYPHVRVCGLMTMAAREGGIDVARKNFAQLRELRDALIGQCPPDVSLAELSMGMSDDFAAAIAEGATIVRIGSALFAGLDD